jgi:ribonucleotide reductase alpha subunit
LRSGSGAIAQKLRPKKTQHPDATKLYLVAHHKECTTPIFYTDANDGTRNESAGIRNTAMLNAGLPDTKNPTIF